MPPVHELSVPSPPPGAAKGGWMCMIFRSKTRGSARVATPMVCSCVCGLMPGEYTHLWVALMVGSVKNKRSSLHGHDLTRLGAA